MTTLSEAQIAAQKTDDGASTKALESKVEFDNERRESLESAYSEGVAEAEAADDIEESAELGEDIEQRFGASDHEVIQGFIEVERAMRQDPVDAAHQLSEWFMRHPNFGEPEKPEKLENQYGEVGVRLPNGKTWWGDEGSIAHTAALAMAKQPRDAAPRKEARAALKEIYPDLSYKAALKRVQDIHREASKNPMKAAARMAAQHGMAIEDENVSPQGLDIDRVIDTEFPMLRERSEEVSQIIHQARDLSGDLRKDLNAIQNYLLQQDQQRANIETVEFVKKHNVSEAIRKRMAQLFRDNKARNLDEAYKLATQSTGLLNDIRQAAK